VLSPRRRAPPPSSIAAATAPHPHPVAVSIARGAESLPASRNAAPHRQSLQSALSSRSSTRSAAERPPTAARHCR